MKGVKTIWVNTFKEWESLVFEDGWKGSNHLGEYIQVRNDNSESLKMDERVQPFGWIDWSSEC
jgi:hypothetical protein